MKRFLLLVLVLAAGLLPKLRGRARSNLRIAFGPAGPRLYLRFLFRFADNIRFVLNACRRTPSRRPKIRFDSVDVVKSISIPRPWIGVTGHVGPFELLTGIESEIGSKISVVVRPPRNRIFRALLNAARRRIGTTFIEKSDVLRESFAALNTGRMVAIFADHNAGFHGTFMPFLGFPASTTRLPAVLALRFQKPIVMAFIRKDGPDLAAWIEKVIVPDPAADRPLEEKRILTEMNDAYSAVIRRYPEEWFWFHQRWKTRPG
ncbi:lysophospholipid acyltransferase family protein, partial [bacterium]|nr:lysophospholipid acyltransferase family protein [bacterium]